jgi:hypothetical protein
MVAAAVAIGVTGARVDGCELGVAAVWGGSPAALGAWASGVRGVAGSRNGRSSGLNEATTTTPQISTNRAIPRAPRRRGQCRSRR